MKKSKKILILLISIISFILLSSYFIGNYFVQYALVPNSGGENRNVENENPISDSVKEKIDAVENKEQTDADNWIKEIQNNIVEQYIISDDGLKLYGHLFYQSENTNKWAIIVHGYQSNETKSYPIAHNFYKNGYNILTISLRAHKPSEGKYIGMGYLDKYDLQKWISHLVNIHPNSNIILHGTSMGGATVLMSQEVSLPKNVKAIIADCSYTSVREIFASELEKRFNLPDSPVLDMAQVVAIYKAGYNINKASALEAVKMNDIPTLFIHTTDDDFVPIEMSKELFENKKGSNKELLIIEGGGHADAKFQNPEKYYSSIFNFINKYKDKDHS